MFPSPGILKWIRRAIVNGNSSNNLWDEEKFLGMNMRELAREPMRDINNDGDDPTDLVEPDDVTQDDECWGPKLRSLKTPGEEMNR
ncbi:hypothetical protein BGZ60DRAFT_529134 [Tricladium varicosporioides]|nr:hypothetical protein BGZ60DRAFT_529134 [Hymenoscyphus varicosporioides]